MGIGDVLSGQLLFYNALTSKVSTLKVNRNEAIIQSVLKEKNNFYNKQINTDCEIEVLEVSIDDIISEENIQEMFSRNLRDYYKAVHAQFELYSDRQK